MRWVAQRGGSSLHAPGTILGSYKILERIGGGGMGDVYRAEHVKIGRHVALKVLKADLAKRQAAGRRFLEEARAVNNIGHPHIVDIFDFVEDPAQDPPSIYLVMELLSGQDLASYVDAHGPLAPAEAVTIACQVAAALSAVHERKVLHRDLKAGNIFLIPQPNGPPRVKVLDFGAVKVLGRDKGELELTDPGMAVGTPYYMAPEQVLDRELDQRTDIYALGVVLFKMLTGKVPFEGTSFPKLLVQVAKGRPPRVSQLREVEPPVPPSLEAVVMCCLEKRPENRFPSMNALEDALQASLGGAAASTGPLDITRAFRSTLQRRRWTLIAIPTGILLVGGIVALALLSGGGTDAADRENSGAATDPQKGPHITFSLSETADAGNDATALEETRQRAARRRAALRRRASARKRRAQKAGHKTPAHLTIVDPFDGKKKKRKRK